MASETVLTELVSAESIPLTLAGSRERVLKTQKIVRVVNGKVDAAVTCRWLLGESSTSKFKVNLLTSNQPSSKSTCDRCGLLLLDLSELFREATQTLCGMSISKSAWKRLGARLNR
jgi:hypothetical protein